MLNNSEPHYNYKMRQQTRIRSQVVSQYTDKTCAVSITQRAYTCYSRCVDMASPLPLHAHKAKLKAHTKRDIYVFDSICTTTESINSLLARNYKCSQFLYIVYTIYVILSARSLNLLRNLILYTQSSFFTNKYINIYHKAR